MKPINTPQDTSKLLEKMMPKTKQPLPLPDKKDGLKTEVISQKKPKRAKKPSPLDGRPSKKDTMDFKMIEELAGLGLTDDQMGLVLGVSKVTINAWKKDPKFLNALKAGKTKADNQVVKSLYERAKGYSHTETVCFQYLGNIITKEITKHYPPDPTSMIFWLKNRDKENWRDRVELEHGVTDETYEKYKALPVSDLQKKLDELMPNRVAGLLQ